VTWATRKETLVATVMVFIFVMMAAVFFFFVDRLMAFGVRLILGLGN
jgi:preprotein translocase subunit SecE